MFKIGEYSKFHVEENLAVNMNQDKLEELPTMSLEELASATNNFDQSNKLGQGGFGPVYRVMLATPRGLLPNRMIV